MVRNCPQIIHRSGADFVSLSIVNGLSWDVVRLLGEKQKLHGLAIEDLLHTRNRTKADWYPEHVFGELIALAPM